MTVRNSRGYMLVGALLTAGGAMLFAAKGILAKSLYADGVGFELLVTVRALIALPLFWAFAIWREGLDAIRHTSPRAMGIAALAGVVCYYVGALTDFYALTMIDASIERVLLFSYPALIVLFASVLTRSWPKPIALVGALVTYVGIFLAVGGLDTAELRANLLGASLVMCSAITYAAYFLIGERYTREIGSARFTLFAMTAAAVALALHYAARHELTTVTALSARSWLTLAILGVACMFVPALMQSEGMRRIGAQRGSVVSTMGPPTTILLAWAFLGERLSVTQVCGVLLIVGSVLALELARLPASQKSALTAPAGRP